MINKYVDDTPFNATEKYLLVPVAAETHDLPNDGFVQSVAEQFPSAELLLRKKFESKGFRLGEVYLAGEVGEWVQPYTLAFAGLHRHIQNGWEQAPEALTKTLSALPKRYGGVTVATAGIPGTGFSGLKGGADIFAIEQVLEEHEHGITIYTRNEVYDNEPRVEPQELNILSAELI